MERVPRQKYTKDSGASGAACTRTGQLVKLGENRRPVTDLEAEVSRLKRKLAEAAWSETS